MSFEKYCHGAGNIEGWMEHNDTPRTDAVTEDDETYRITPKGVLSLVLNSNDCQKAADALELYIRRNNKAIYVEHNRLTFVDLEPV